MMKIGDFSRLTRISIRMLRYYDEHEILKPSYIDEETSYRFYDDQQLLIAHYIQFYRQLGFTSVQIKQLLDCGDKTEQLRIMKMHQVEIEMECDRAKEKLLQMKQAIEMLEKEDHYMKYDVEYKTIPAVRVMSTRGIIPSYDKEGLLWARLCSEPNAYGWDVQYRLGGAGRAIFYDEGFKEQEVDVEVCMEVENEFTNTDHLQFKTIPEQDCACVTFKGSYEQTTAVCEAIGAWIAEHGYSLNGENFCIYHVGHGSGEMEENFITEVCFPIKK